MQRTFALLMIRRFFKNLSFSVIILGGLVVGLTSAILVSLWVKYEVSYDRYHPENSKVFAIMFNEAVDGSIETFDETSARLADFITSDLHQVESFTRFDNSRPLITVGEKTIQKLGLYADSGFFETFHPVLIYGIDNPMRDNQSIVISEELSKLLFENINPLGRSITIDNSKDFTVTGVIANFPANSSLHPYEFILPINAKQHIEESNN